MSILIELTQEQKDWFADHYRKEGAAEAEDKFQRAVDARQLQYDRAVRAEEQIAATELVVEQMREALIEMDANHKDWSECCQKVIKALQLQPSHMLSSNVITEYVEEELRRMASELRLAASKRKEHV
jgi:hypothetical protein